MPYTASALSLDASAFFPLLSWAVSLRGPLMKLTHRFADPTNACKTRIWTAPACASKRWSMAGISHTMPQAIKLIDAESRNSQPGGRVFPHCGFFDPKVPLSSLLYIRGERNPPSRVRHWAVGVSGGPSC